MIERLRDDCELQRASSALSRRLLDGVLVLGRDMAEPLRVSASGEVLWALLAERCTVADLVAVWSELYGVVDLVAREEILPVLALWLEGGAVTLLESASAGVATHDEG